MWAAIILHSMQLGILWRYAKLFIPVDLRYVKHEVRDLCKYTIFIYKYPPLVKY